MIKSKIRAFYQYDGRTKSDPFREELASGDIEYHLRRLPEELAYALETPNLQPTVTLIRSDLANRQIWLSIECCLSKNEYDNAIKQTLNGLDLFAEQLEFAETR